jgi:hypothetical protein
LHWLRRRNASHTNSPVTASPRSRNHQVVGAALVAKAAGRGHRSIAADLHRPASTVRRWLRAVRGEHGRWLYRQGVEHTFRFAPEVLGEMVAHPTELGDALAALAAAALAFRRRFARHLPARSLVGIVTRGRLLNKPPPGTGAPFARRHLEPNGRHHEHVADTVNIKTGEISPQSCSFTTPASYSF